MLTLLLAGVASAAGAAPSVDEAKAPTPPKNVEALMAGFAGLTGFEARFVETKTMALLAVPLKTEGRLYFSAPARLLRVVDKPQPARVLVTPTEVTMKAAGSNTQRLDLAARPEVRALVSSLLSLLTGDLNALRGAYRLDYAAGGDGRWRLQLTPKSDRIAALVAGLRFEGIGRAVDRITVEESSGDRVVTEIRDADPGRRFSAEEQRRLFGGFGSP